MSDKNVLDNNLKLLEDTIFPYGDQKITNWRYEKINKDIMIYYNVFDPAKDILKMGFDFLVLDFFNVETVFYGRAFWDGIRHLQTGNIKGYAYYPIITDYIDIFKKLKELELKYCEECEIGFEYED